jgi:hypothetical protein
MTTDECGGCDSGLIPDVSYEFFKTTTTLSVILCQYIILKLGPVLIPDDYGKLTPSTHTSPIHDKVDQKQKS